MLVWRGAHQLALYMRAFYWAVPDEFYLTFKSVVAHLRRKQNFISEEQSCCLLICDTSSFNRMKVTTWFDKYRLAVVAYLKWRTRACKPDEAWSILLLVVHEIVFIAIIMCISIQR